MSNRQDERDATLQLDDRSLAAACVIKFSLGAGNGGQHRNKTFTAVRIRHTATGLESTDCSGRSQHRNLCAALYKLRLKIALSRRTHPAADLPRSRCAPGHPDYPLWTARLLDHLEEQHWEIKAAAAELQCSPSSLLKLIARDPSLCKYVNDQRTALSLTRLRF